MNNKYDKERDCAIEAVRMASILSSSLQDDIVKNASFVAKADFSPVTAADFGCQAIINQLIDTRFPNAHIIGEEGSQALVDDPALSDVVVDRVRSVLDNADIDAKSVHEWIDIAASRQYQSRFWTVDPIDGTAGFLNGRQYAIALALIEEGEIVVSALACPNLNLDSDDYGVISWAVKGEGAWIRYLKHDGSFVGEAKRLVLDTATKKPSRFCESFEPSHSDQGWSKRIAEKLNITEPPVRMDSQVKYVLIAAGAADVYLRLPAKNYIEHIWDHAGGELIVSEAGGHVTDAYGKKLVYTHGSDLVENRGVIVSGLSAHEHARVIEETSRNPDL